jgi:hypothetical protein
VKISAKYNCKGIKHRLGSKIMSKGSGMGRKRIGALSNKGMDKCDVGSHSKQCGRPKEITKGKPSHNTEHKH